MAPKRLHTQPASPAPATTLRPSDDMRAEFFAVLQRLTPEQLALGRDLLRSLKDKGPV